MSSVMTQGQCGELEFAACGANGSRSQQRRLRIGETMNQLFNVFAVDDDPVVLGVMQAILEPDCQLQLYPSAEDCLQQLQSEKPDLFLLDVNLPAMNGFALCRAIRSDAALKNTPVIFVSGCDTIEERIKGYDAGGQDFIVKPFEPEELLRKLLVAQNGADVDGPARIVAVRR